MQLLDTTDLETSNRDSPFLCRRSAISNHRNWNRPFLPHCWQKILIQFLKGYIIHIMAQPQILRAIPYFKGKQGSVSKDTFLMSQQSESRDLYCCRTCPYFQTCSLPQKDFIPPEILCKKSATSLGGGVSGRKEDPVIIGYVMEQFCERVLKNRFNLQTK